MTAWEALKAASRLAAGTAWQLLTNPRLGGQVVGDGVSASIDDAPIFAAVSTPQYLVDVELREISAAVAPAETAVSVDDDLAALQLESSPINVKASP